MTPVSPFDIAQRPERSKHKEGEKQHKESRANSEDYGVVAPSINRSMSAQSHGTTAQRITDDEPTAGSEYAACCCSGYRLQFDRPRRVSAESWLSRSAHADNILG